MTLGNLMDLMNRDYDRQDPKFLQEIQLGVYAHSKEAGMGQGSIRIKENMVMDPQTIGQPKDSNYLQGMEQRLQAIDQAYLGPTNQQTESKTR